MPLSPVDPSHGLQEASPWVRRFAACVPAGGSVLDVACGAGRHARYFAARGHAVTAIDRDAQALASLHGSAVRCIEADLEGAPWPLPGACFDAVVVTHYLWRALLPTLVASVAAGGVLIYETFAQGNAAFGKPSNPQFLLAPGELLQACAGLRVVAYEDGVVRSPRPAVVQRICARRESGGPLQALPLESQD